MSRPKIIKLKQKFSIKRKFAFKSFTEEFFKNIVNGLSWNEAAGGYIPLNLMKESTFILLYLPHCFNEYLVKGELVHLNPRIFSQYRKKRILLIKQIQACQCIIITIKSFWKDDVRTILWILEQLFEWPTFFQPLHILSRLIQSLKKELDNSDLVGTILMDLSKTYYCLPFNSKTWSISSWET